MNNSDKRSITFLGMIMCFSLYSAACDSETQKKIEDATPFSLFGMIDTAKINAFDAEELIKKNLDPKKIAVWDTMLACNSLYINEQVNQQHAFESYKNYCIQMDETNDFIKNNLHTLHKKFSYIFEPTSLMTKLKALQGNLIPPADYQYLHQLKREIELYSKKMKAIIGVALQKIDMGLATPDEWYAQSQEPRDFFPCYKDFFTSYYEAKKNSKNETLSTRELLYFIKITNVFNTKCLKIIHHDEASKAAAIVEVLKKLQYALEHEFIKSVSAKERTNILSASKEIIEGLQTAYPDMITEFHFKKLSLTQDKASIIIFAQAKSLVGILEDLTKKIHQILTKRSES